MKADWNDPNDVRRYYREYARRYRELHPESTKLSNYKQYWKNPEHHKSRSKERQRSVSRAIWLMYQQFLYLSNREARRDSWRRYYRKAKHVIYRSKKIWESENRDKRRAWNKNRKYLKRSKNGISCAAKLLLLSSERFCRWCCTPLTSKNRTVDHVIPLSRGGEHIPDNLVACCSYCNCSKGNKLVHEWTWEAA